MQIILEMLNESTGDAPENVGNRLSSFAKVLPS
jgi:hypothetical protein